MADASPTNPPPPLQCLSCWYTIGVDDAAACPECGEPVTEVTRRLFYRRAALALEARPGMTRSTLTILAGVAIYVALIAMSTSDGSLILTGLLSTSALALLGWGAGFAITPWLGALARATDLRPERALTRLLWNRHVVLLHVPWLLPPVLAVLLGVVVVFCRLVSTKPEMAETVAAFVLFVVWLAACIIAISEWSLRWGQDLDAACLRSTRLPTNAALVVLVLFAINWVAGVIGTVSLFAAAWQLLP